MTLEEKQLVMGIARDIYIENLRKGKNVPVGTDRFANVVKDVKEGLESLDRLEVVSAVDTAVDV
jgi:hypothetical protein